MFRSPAGVEETLVRAAEGSHERQPRRAGVLSEQELQEADPRHRPEGVRGGDAERAAQDTEGLPREAPLCGEDVVSRFLPGGQNGGGDERLDQQHQSDLPFREHGGRR